MKDILMVSRSILIYTLKAAFRDYMIRVILCSFLIILALSSFFGSSAISESLAFTAVYAASSMRLVASIGIMLFIAFYFQRAYASKDIDFILSRPVGRAQFVISSFFSFILIAFLLAFVTVSCLSVLTWFNMHQSLLLWGIGLFAEIALVAAITMFFSIMLNSPLTSFASSFGFYVLSRMSGAIFGTIDADQAAFPFSILGKVMEVISIILPRLDLIVKSEWIVYGTSDYISSVLYALVTVFCFSIFILFACIIDLKRKEF
jgi:hypothetical protein